jgi:hypothetical protein
VAYELLKQMSSFYVLLIDILYKFELLKDSFSMIQFNILTYCLICSQNEKLLNINADDFKLPAIIKSHLNSVKFVYTVETQYYIGQVIIRPKLLNTRSCAKFLRLRGCMRKFLTKVFLSFKQSSSFC